MGAKPTLEERLNEIKSAMASGSAAEIVDRARAFYEAAVEKKVLDSIAQEPADVESSGPTRPDETPAVPTPEPVAEEKEVPAVDALFREPKAEEPIAPKAPSRNIGQRADGILIDFNDRWAFVNKLFDRNQDDFNRVVSQLNTMSTFIEARNFIDHVVKPDYNWADQEEFEQRFLDLVERHFK